MQIVKDAKRTVICPPEVEDVLEEAVEKEGLDKFFKIHSSPYLPPNTIFIIHTKDFHYGQNDEESTEQV